MAWKALRGFASIVFFILMPSALAQNDGMGRLAEFLPQTQQDPPWSYRSDGNGFAMVNQSDPGAVSYFYVLREAGQQGGHVTETDVTLAEGSQGGAGLIFGFDPESRNYFAFAVEASGALKIFRRDQNGFNEIATFGEMARIGSTNRLTIVEHVAEAEFLLNGTRVGAIEGVVGGGVGIVGLGIVDVRFGGFSDGLKQGASLPSSAGSTPADTPPNGAGLSQAPLRLVPLEIIDQTAPFGRTVAYDAMIPQGWVTDGGVVWNPPNGCHRGGHLVWGAETPDGSYGIGFLPPISWSANNYGGVQTGCIGADLPDAEAMIRTYFGMMPNTQAQADILEVTRPPELQPAIRQLSTLIAPVPNTRMWVDGVLVRASLVEDGRPNDAYILVFTMHWEGATPDGFGQGGMLVSRGGNLFFGLVVATPPGKLDEGHPAFAAIVGNLRARQEWSSAVAKWWASQKPPTSTSPAPTSTVGADSSSVTDMMFESWQRREGMNDRGHAKSIGGLWETEKYRTSDGVVSLSQNYRNAWELNDGSLVLTDDDNFNPLQTFDEFGTQLQRVE